MKSKQRLLLVVIASLTAGIVCGSAEPLWAVPVPEAPQVTVVGQAGTGEACYWVVAEDAQRRLTSVSPPTHVQNLPDALDENNYASIKVTPIEEAAKYYILKTAPLAEPAPATVEVANPGEATYYYWIVACNGFRQSQVYGPYPAENCGDPQGNVITWNRVYGASWYHLYRTESPLGRTYCVVGLQLGMDPQFRPGMYGSGHQETKMTDRGLSYGVVGYPATPIGKPPLGEGKFLLAQTAGEEVQDQGQPLKIFLVPNVNETEVRPVTVPADNQPNIRTHGMAVLDTRASLENLARPSFIAHYAALQINSFLEAGAHSEYQDTPGSPGWKSTIENIASHQTSHCGSQTIQMHGYQRNYGSGDTIWFSPSTTVWGPNDDNGDEGCYSIRASVSRVLEEINDTLAEDALRGSVTLAVAGGNYGNAGTGRVVVNLSQAYIEGRIRRVGNVDVHGKGTNWTKEMKGRWISFDVDTVKGHRMWYQVVDVQGPTEVTILARTGWSSACNLGYSRFIYDPEQADHASPMWTNSHANITLPEEKVEAAREGGYMICPGSLLGNPWKSGKTLNVEPLRETWKAGDEIQIAPGPQAYVYLARFMLFGDYLPQDDVGGIQIANYGNRAGNFPGLQIGNPGAANFTRGIDVSLARHGMGDGVVVQAATGWDERGLPTGSSGAWRGAFIAPVNIPALRDEYRGCPYPIFVRPEEDIKTASLQFRAPNQAVLMQLNRDNITINSPLHLNGALYGSEQTRGKAIFSGDGQLRQFTIKFARAFAGEPFVTISTNQFAHARLAQVAADHMTIEFEEAPEAGEDNVVIYWMAQQ